MAAHFYERNTSGMNADRFINRLADESTVNAVQRHYWTARQLIRSKLGKKEDAYLEASDNELDTCLNLYRNIHSTSFQLLNCIDNYANYLLDETLVQNVLGKYLKEKGKIDKSESVGQILIASGRSLLYSSHRLNSARIRISTFYNKLAVFVERAVGDCSQTIEGVQMVRTEYRGSLLWMKKASEELDPDVDGSLEKFREAQAIVKVNKERLDKLKVDTLQKVDLLSASRSNLLSYVLTHYQNELYEYYEKTASAYETLAENINSYNNYDFEVLSSLLTGTKQNKKKPDNETDKTGDSELKNLLFGRESPTFDMHPTEADEHCDSPLIDDFGPSTSEQSTDLIEMPTTSPSSFKIGPLEKIYNEVSHIPILQPPPSNKPAIDDLLLLEEQPKTSEWDTLLSTIDNQCEDNLL